MKLQRILIATDGDSWYVRHIRYVKHDGIKDEKIYYCDFPVGAKCKTLDEATLLAKEYLSTKVAS